MSASATTSYFIQNSKSFLVNPASPPRITTGLGTATLVDSDLVRGDDAGEAVTLGFGRERGGGFRRFFDQDREVLTSLTFDDGTILTGVRALVDGTNFNISGNLYFLFDSDALAAVGKSISDVAKVNSFALFDHDLTWSDLGFSGGNLPAPEPQPEPEQSTEATAMFFSQNNQSFIAQPTFNVFLDARIGVATLVDDDLIRGNDAGEAVTIGVRVDGGPLTASRPTEVLTSIAFADGTTLAGVKGVLFNSATSSSFGLGTSTFLFDADALAAAGKTVVDVARVISFTTTDHDLTWADLGFAGGNLPEPGPPVPDLIEGIPTTAIWFSQNNQSFLVNPTFNVTLETDLGIATLVDDDLILGGEGNDRLIGGKGDDVIIGGNGNDRLTSGLGEDMFIFGTDTRDGNRDRDLVTDYNAALDTIVLEAGATIRSSAVRDGGLLITLNGDGDTIFVEGAGPIILGNIALVDDLFLV